MSLINDALRRAKHSQPATTPAEVSHALRPVEATAVAHRNSSNLLLPVLIVVLLVGGGLFIGIALSQRGGKGAVTVNARQPAPEVVPQAAQPVVSTPAPQPAVQPVAVVPAPAPQPAVQANATPPVPAQAAVVTMPVAATTATMTNEAALVAPVEVVPPKPALPIVRGIFFNPTRPSAVLNTKTVLVGDSYSGFRVLSITRDGVTVVKEGVTNVLTLAE
ncbi:MAG TPA: hypothetical protein PKA41_15285 [Verrucomicrobiota bacterium]|nr:hypothetical protein [Verrucomicrobiota bacterium]